MKNIIRVLALILTAALVFGMLISCAASTPAVMKYKDSSISASMYSYWLSTYKSSFLSYYNSSLDSDEFWSSPATDNMSAEEYALELINKNIKYILVGMQLFREYGLKIDSDTTAAINEDLAEKTDYFGSRAELNSALSEFGINADILKEIYIAEEKLYAVYDYLYGDNGIEKVTDAQIDQYYEDNYSRIRYIVVYTNQKVVTDENGEAQYDSEGNVLTAELSDEEKAEKQAKVEEIMLCVNAGDDFAALQTNYNEVDMSYYSDGFFVSPNELGIYGFQMVSETESMKVGETRKVVDEYATYIVEKLPLIARNEFIEADTEQLENLEKYCIQQYYEDKFAPLAEEIEVYESELANFDIRTASPNSYF